jgi:hypothetical protein
MTPISLKTAIGISLLTGFCGLAIAADIEAEKKHLVIRLFELTESNVQTCDGTSAGATYGQQAKRFIEANQKLLSLVRQSPHYKHAKQFYAHDISRKRPKHELDALARDCEYFSNVIAAMIDTPEGRAEVVKFENALSQ